MEDYVVTVNESGVTFKVQNGETILTAARRQGVWPTFECGWGSCGTCKATLMSGEVTCLLPEAPSLSERDQRRQRIILCQTVPNSDVTLKAKVTEEPPEHLATGDYQAVVTDVEFLADEVARFRLEVDRPADYQPGQYAILNLGNGLRRAYSMANLPGSRELEFIARRYPGGIGSQTLFKLTPGTELTLDLPYGSAFLKDTSRPKVFVAGGTGISPILSMIRQLSLRENVNETKNILFYGARTARDLVMLNEMERLMDPNDGSTVIPVLSQTETKWDGQKGFVTDALMNCLPEPWNQYEFYVAGPPIMVQAVQNLLREREVDVTHVHYDSFG